MPFCPNCFAEFDFGMEICPHCHRELVADDSDESADDRFLYDDTAGWVTIGILQSESAADKIMETLTANDIPAVIIPLPAGDNLLAGQASGEERFSILVPRDFRVTADTEASKLLGKLWDSARIVDPDDD